MHHRYSLIAPIIVLRVTLEANIQFIKTGSNISRGRSKSLESSFRLDLFLNCVYSDNEIKGKLESVLM